MKIVNERTNNLLGQNIGYVPIENLFTDKELEGLGKDDFYRLVDTMCDDGMKMKELLYSDGRRELRFYID
ncbi:MAG: hypothetical protein IJM15_01420 [Erysipelotrichaceae bacterium]|nr:hypothetical protein [Erysipelotrichaceae bacterium]